MACVALYEDSVKKCRSLVSEYSSLGLPEVVCHFEMSGTFLLTDVSKLLKYNTLTIGLFINSELEFTYPGLLSKFRH